MLHFRTAAAIVACMMIVNSLSAAEDAASPLILEKADGYRGIWYFNQKQDNEYVYKYSGGLGTYCAKHIPLAVYAPEVDKTFFVYGGTRGDNETLLHMVSCYDHKTGMVPRPTILLDKKTTDAHDNPVLSIDDHGHLWVFCSSHGTTRPSYVLRSVEPYDIDAFECVDVTNFSYPQIWHVPDRGFLFVHTRYAKGHRRLFWMTSPDGRTWSEPQMLAYIQWGHYCVSGRSSDKIGVALNMHPTGRGLNWRTNLYYVETTDFGRSWHAADGTPLSMPITEADSPALVHDYQAQGRNVYMKDIAFDAEGRPVILYLTSGGWQSGPENGPRIWQTAHWDGSEWRLRGSIESDNNYDTGCLTIEADGLWRIVGPTEAGPQPYNPGGEMAMWISRDQGASWQLDRRMTEGSEFNHTYTRKVVGGRPAFHALWADGHGRRPSESRLYFCDREGNVYRLPETMVGEMAKPLAGN